ncbi:MAG: LamG-like jellyroll fold domain-containing protein [Bacteroidota bacterium]
MKRQLLLLLVTLSLTVAGLAQHAGNSLGLNPVDYVEIPDNGNTSLDINDGFTFEAWIFNFGLTANQKVAGKIGGDFRNGFIYGIEDLQVNLEVFDETGTNTKLKAGTVSGIGWTHVAGTYEVGGMLVIYVNGVKAGETAASAAPHGPTESPFRIGIAPWDTNALGYVGYVDEVRYWNAALDEATIFEWMHKDVNSAHPDFAELALYHKYNEDAGPTVADESTFENDGVFSTTGGQTLEPLNLPFKGDFGLFENGVQGFWNAKGTGTSDILSVDAFFVDTLDFGQSALFSNSDGDYSIVPMSSNGLAGRLSKVWRVTTQGDLFLVNFSFDLNAVDLTDYNDPVLLVSDDDDFSDANQIPGNLAGGIFSVNDEGALDGNYFAVGFQSSTSTFDVRQNDIKVSIAPNPNLGEFSLLFEKPAAELDMSIYDWQGKMVWHTVLPAGQDKHRIDLTTTLQAGLYAIKLTDDIGRTTLQKMLVK